MSARAPGPERVEAALRRWLEEHGLASYDPYDGLACAAPWSLVRRHRLTARLWTQVIKKSPINLRPFVGIEPRASAKSLADLAAAALLRHRLGMDATALESACRLLEQVKSQALPGYAGACWGLPTPYVTRFISAAADDPNLFWTVCIAATLLDSYELTGDATDLALARSSVDFVLQDLGCVEEGEGGMWFRYFVDHDAAVYNVTALTGTLMLRVAAHTREEFLVDLGRRALRFVLRGQNEDGSWHYARGPQGRWIDGFHTGYVLEALSQAAFLAPDSAAEVRRALHRGARFYHERMFTPHGLPCYLADRLYPIEVQNCAQAIQTWSLLGCFLPEGNARARQVADAVTHALFRPSSAGGNEAGYFVMSRGRWWTNALPAVRWGQAPMLLAFTHLLAAERELRPLWIGIEAPVPRA